MPKEVIPGRVWLLLGARRVGKTVMVKDFIRQSELNWYTGHGEDATLSGVLESCSLERFKQLFAGMDGFFLDEAHAVKGIGKSLKLLVDALPGLRIIATGSSAFHLDQELGQPLTGRRRVAHLHPISAEEIIAWKGPLAAEGLLEDLLLYGSYPEVLAIADPAERIEYLRQLVEDYLFQDILKFENLRNARKLRDLAILVAHQTGSELSHNELANALDINRGTVERYLDLLEKSFVLFPIRGFSGNLRKEVTKSTRYYFVDCGIRNAVIDQFQPLSLRADKGALWENFFINERRRFLDYRRSAVRDYFWRTYDQQEIDRIEQGSTGELTGFECKWKPKSYRPPAGWTKAYPDAPVHRVHPGNFMDYLTD